MSPARSPGASAGQAFPSTMKLPSASRPPSHQPSSILMYLYPAFAIPFDAMALACSIVTFESTVFENAFHEDHPIGGGGTTICRGPLSAVADPAKVIPANARNIPAANAA